MSQRIEKLRQDIEVMHKCKAKHEASTPLIEMFGSQKVWEGVVESFQLIGHPKAKRAYGWIQPKAEGEAEDRIVTVLEIPPVVDAQTAVRAAIVSQVKS